jgi:hypothetical protein
MEIPVLKLRHAVASYACIWALPSKIVAPVVLRSAQNASRSFVA